MTAPARPSSRGTHRRSVLLRALLAVAFLAPIAVLYTQVWRADADRAAYAIRERHGIAYLSALEPITTALSRAESVAVTGQSVSFDAIDHAVAGATIVDNQIGTALRTHDRWNDLRTRLQQLHTRTITGAPDALTAYGQVTSLVLALEEKVRDDSGLARDPDAGVFYLEDAAARQLPESVVAAGRYGDLVIVASDEPPVQQQATAYDLVVARTGLLTNAADLGDDVRAAADATSNPTLSGELLSTLDRFRLGVDALAPAATIAGGTVTPGDPAQTAQYVAETRSAGTALSGVMLGSIDNLLVARINAIGSHQWRAIGTLALAILIALTPLAIALLGARRGGSAPDEGGDPARPSAEPGQRLTEPGQRLAEPSHRATGPGQIFATGNVRAAKPAYVGATPPGGRAEATTLPIRRPVRPVDETGSAERERSGAPR